MERETQVTERHGLSNREPYQVEVLGIRRSAVLTVGIAGIMGTLGIAVVVTLALFAALFVAFVFFLFLAAVAGLVMAGTWLAARFRPGGKLAAFKRRFQRAESFVASDAVRHG